MGNLWAHTGAIGCIVFNSYRGLYMYGDVREHFCLFSIG